MNLLPAFSPLTDLPEGFYNPPDGTAVYPAAEWRYVFTDDTRDQAAVHIRFAGGDDYDGGMCGLWGWPWDADAFPSRDDMLDPRRTVALVPDDGDGVAVVISAAFEEDTAVAFDRRAHAELLDAIVLCEGRVVVSTFAYDPGDVFVRAEDVVSATVGVADVISLLVAA